MDIKKEVQLELEIHFDFSFRHWSKDDMTMLYKIIEATQNVIKNDKRL